MCGDVNSAGETVVAGTVRVLELGAGADALDVFRTIAAEWEASDASDSVLLLGLSVVSVDV